jgi:hypothetical protein
MAEVDDFLGTMLPKLHEAELAFHNGDPGLRMANVVAQRSGDPVWCPAQQEWVGRGCSGV